MRGNEQKKNSIVLFIDDETNWLEAIRMAVGDQPLTIITAASGEEALRKLQKRRPDLILSDVRMPEMNGFDLFEKVRSDPKFKTVPYVFMSSIDDFDAKRTAKLIGADGYIEKPFDLESVKRVVLDLLLRFKTTRR
jgi:response regulator RpfG family c-di-GMP phosphodiesterase